MKILIRECRLSFPQLWEPRKYGDDGKAAYAAHGIIGPDDPQLDEINDIIEKVAQEQWGNKAKSILGMLRGKDLICLHNGDQKADQEAYPGNWYISARSYTRPTVFDRDRTPLTEETGRPYAGCYVNLSVDIYAQDNKWGKRINASLRGVQFVRDGDAFAGGAPASEDEFEDLSTAEDLA